MAKRWSKEEKAMPKMTEVFKVREGMGTPAGTMSTTAGHAPDATDRMDAASNMKAGISAGPPKQMSTVKAGDMMKRQGDELKKMGNQKVQVVGSDMTGHMVLPFSQDPSKTRQAMPSGLKNTDTKPVDPFANKVN